MARQALLAKIGIALNSPIKGAWSTSAFWTPHQ
jgi:hypothetical protein